MGWTGTRGKQANGKDETGFRFEDPWSWLQGEIDVRSRTVPGQQESPTFGRYLIQMTGRDPACPHVEIHFPHWVYGIRVSGNSWAQFPHF